MTMHFQRKEEAEGLVVVDWSKRDTSTIYIQNVQITRQEMESTVRKQ